MSTPSKVTSPRRTRKTKSAPLPEPTRITPAMTRAQGWNAYHEFAGNLTDAEMKVVGHLLPLTFPTPQAVVLEARRLLGESIAKCKVIPFPVGGKRGAQVAKEA